MVSSCLVHFNATVTDDKRSPYRQTHVSCFQRVELNQFGLRRNSSLYKDIHTSRWYKQIMRYELSEALLKRIEPTVPGSARKDMAWSMPPPSVPMWCSQCWHKSANSTYNYIENLIEVIFHHSFKHKTLSHTFDNCNLLIFMVTMAAQQTRALELERPELAGMLPSNKRTIPEASCKLKWSRIPL